MLAGEMKRARREKHSHWPLGMRKVMYPSTLAASHCYASDRGTYTDHAPVWRGERRTVPASLRLKALLQEGLLTRGNASTVIAKNNGTPWTPNVFTKAFTATCQRAALERLSPHVLRHTFASRLV